MALNNLYSFYKQEKTTVNKAVLALLVAKKDIVSKSKLNEINKLYEYAESIEEDIKSEDIDFEQQIINQQIIKMLEADKINSFLNNPLDQGLFNILLLEFSLVSAATNSVFGIGHYLAAELEDIIKKDKYKGDLVFYRTLCQAILGFNTSQYVRVIGKNLFRELQDPATTEEWEEALIWLLCLQVLWKDFKFLDKDTQLLILQNYFYIAIASGVSIYERIKEFLIDSTDLVDYMSKNKLIFDALSVNHEVVPVFLNNRQDVGLSDLLKNYLDKNPDNFTKERQAGYISKLYSQATDQQSYVGWLKESLSIFIGARTAKLIDFNQRREVLELTRYEQDLLDLTGWCLIKQKWFKVEEYFKKRGQPVGLNNFFSVLYYGSTLNNMDVVDRLIDFTEFLHQKKLLSPDQDLIIYHEQDGQFHWNREVIES